MFSFSARDYDQARSFFRIEVPEQFNLGFDVIDRVQKPNFPRE